MYVCMYGCMCIVMCDLCSCVYLCCVCKGVEANDMQHSENVIGNLELSAVFGVYVLVLCARVCMCVHELVCVFRCVFICCYVSTCVHGSSPT